MNMNSMYYVLFLLFFYLIHVFNILLDIHHCLTMKLFYQLVGYHLLISICSIYQQIIQRTFAVRARYCSGYLWTTDRRVRQSVSQSNGIFTFGEYLLLCINYLSNKIIYTNNKFKISICTYKYLVEMLKWYLNDECAMCTMHFQ